MNGQDDNQYHFHELDVPDLGNTLHVRFDAAMSSSKDYWYIDNVEVTGAPAGPPNQAPAITTSPVTTATEDLLYSYDVDASDPDAGDTLTFSLDSAPSGMTIDANTGVIQWTPNNAQVGSNPVTVRVKDAGGLFDTQSFNVSVANTNDAPSIGNFLGHWDLDSRNTVPRGITIDPSNVDDIWVVDSTDDAIYEYTAAASRTSGSQSASNVYNLAGSNTNPQGIADPPPFDSSDTANVQDEMATRSLDLTDFLRGTEWTSRALRRSSLQIPGAEQDEPIFRTVPPQAHPNSRSAIRQGSRAREEVFAALEKVEQEALDDELLDALLQQGSARTIVRVDA